MGNRDRITDMTPYLAQKWRREGYRPKEIALVLNRTPKAVQRALAVKLPKEQYRAMEVFYCERQRRRNTTA